MSRHDSTQAPPSFTLPEMIAEAKREVAMRERVYPRWIDAGKLKPSEAARRISLMKAIADELERRQQPGLL